MANRPSIRHCVFFSAKDKSDIPTIIKGLEMLAQIPYCEVFEVRQNSRRDQIANDVDVVVYAEFKDQAAFDAYKADPIYQKSIDVVRPLRDLRIAADF